MNLAIELPQYETNILRTWTNEELIKNMIHDEDRVPRNVIDECARRGEQMLPTLAPIAAPNDELENETSGHWWLRLHTVMILGLIPGEAAGLLLLEFIRSMCLEEDENLQEWLSSCWPALMRNKPAPVIALLRDMCMDKNIDYFMRTNITDAVIADANAKSEQALEQTLDWAAQLAADKEEDWLYRLCTGSTLLDFPRERYRELLETLAAEQSGLGVHFDKNDIDKAYKRNNDKPGWDRFDDPWHFYEPQHIEKRQRRWQKEDLEKEHFMEEANNEGFGDLLSDDLLLDDLLMDDMNFHYNEPYQRETPKIGRNDPCHCGSGKKYKKCCLN